MHTLLPHPPRQRYMTLNEYHHSSLTFDSPITQVELASPETFMAWRHRSTMNETRTLLMLWWSFCSRRSKKSRTSLTVTSQITWRNFNLMMMMIMYIWCSLLRFPRRPVQWPKSTCQTSTFVFVLAAQALHTKILLKRYPLSSKPRRIDYSLVSDPLGR